MRGCRSCSPPPRVSLRSPQPNTVRTRTSQRRCHSLSPQRTSRRFFERPCRSPLCGASLTCDPCSQPSHGPCRLRSYNTCLPPRLDSLLLPGSRRCRAAVCSPCVTPIVCSSRPRPRLTSTCCTSSSYRAIPCNSPPLCRRDRCYPRYDPCVTSPDFSYPRLCSPCSPSRYRPCYRPRRDSCLPCATLRSPLCDLPCYTPRTRLTTSPCLPFRSCSPLNLRSCAPLSRGSCDPLTCRPCNPSRPCYLPYCTTCTSGTTRTYRPRCPSPCGDSPESSVKLRDLTCDPFRKIVYPKELPIRCSKVQSCSRDLCNCNCVPLKDGSGETAKVDAVPGYVDKGPSWKFLQKSKKLGEKLARFESHLCPWEADMSISGTVRGHCTSTAVEVARKMSGRFYAEGERYTTDSCENKVASSAGNQLMSLGMLDDGSALNFSRNNDPDEKRELLQPKGKLTKSKESPSSCTDRNGGKDNNGHIGQASVSKSKPVTDQFSSGVNRKGSMSPTRKKMTSNRPSCDLTGACGDINADRRRSPCSRRSSHHSVRFDSEDKPELVNKTGHSCAGEDGCDPLSQVQSFLSSDRTRRREHGASTQSGQSSRLASQDRPQDRVRYPRLRISPDSRLVQHRHSPALSDLISPTYSTLTHRSTGGDCLQSFSSLNHRQHTSHPLEMNDDRRGVQYCEISFKSDGNTVSHRTSRGISDRVSRNS